MPPEITPATTSRSVDSEATTEESRPFENCTADIQRPQIEYPDDAEFLKTLQEIELELERLEIRDHATHETGREAYDNIQAVLEDLRARVEAIEIREHAEASNDYLEIVRPGEFPPSDRIHNLIAKHLHPLRTDFAPGDFENNYTTYNTINTTLNLHAQAFRNEDEVENFIALINERNARLENLQIHAQTEQQLVQGLLDLAHFEYMYGIDQKGLLHLQQLAHANGNARLVELIEIAWRWETPQDPIEVEIQGPLDVQRDDIDLWLNQAAALENRALAEAHEFLERYQQQQDALAIAPAPFSFLNNTFQPPATKRFEIKKIHVFVPPHREHGIRRHTRDRRRSQQEFASQVTSRRTRKEARAPTCERGQSRRKKRRMIRGRWVGKKTYFVSRDSECSRARGFYVYLK